MKKNLFILLSFLITGCAHQMTLEEAKSIPLQMVDQAVIAPPRKVNDVLAELERYQVDASILQENIRKADAKPSSEDMNELKSFYRKRAYAAKLTGRSDQVFEDLRLALKNASGWTSRRDILRELAMAELEAGNYGAALQTMKNTMEEFSSAQTGYKMSITNHVLMSKIYSVIGDQNEAKLHSESAFNGARDINQRDPPAPWTLSDLSASGYEMDGNWEYASRSILESIGYIKRSFQEKNKREIGIIERKLQLSNALIHQGKFSEAEANTRTSLKDALQLAGRDSIYSAQAISQLAEIFQLQGRGQDAVSFSQKAVSILVRIGANESSPALIKARYILGKSLMLQQDWQESSSQFRSILAATSKYSDAGRSLLLNDPDIGVSLIKSKQYGEAVRILQKICETLSVQLGKDHYDTAEAQAVLAIAEYHNNKDSAITSLRKAFPALLAKLGAKEILRQEERTFRIKFIADEYLSMVFADIPAGSVADKVLNEVLTISEAMRAGTLQKAIVDQTLRAISSRDKDLSGTVSKYQELQVQAERMASQLSSLSGSLNDAALEDSAKRLRARLLSLNEASRVLLVEIKKRMPEYDALVNPAGIDVSGVKRILKPGEIMMSIYPTDSGTFVWAIPQDGASRFSKTDMSEQEISNCVAKLRKSLDPEPQMLGDIPEFDLNVSYNLYEKLLKPLESLWQKQASIILVSHGALNQLPLYLLPTAPPAAQKSGTEMFSQYRTVPWLVKKTSITSVPSLDSLKRIRSANMLNSLQRPYIGFGDPIYNNTQLQEAVNSKPITRSMKFRGLRVTEKGSLNSSNINTAKLSQLSRLPDTADEVNTVASILDADTIKDVFLRERASEHLVKTMDLSNRKIVAFASHALVPGDLDGLDQPALALSSPEVTGDREDGILTLQEVMTLKLNADWVILSACNTGSAEGAGKEALTGLGKAFFFAGTKSLLASMWPVETTSAMKLVTGTFQSYKNDKLNRTEALRNSILNLIDSNHVFETSKGIIIISYAHPIYWAPFVLVGDGSGILN